MSDRIARAIDTSIPPLDVKDDPWEWWRCQMPVVEKWAYFDHSAVAPLPSATATVLREFATQASQEGDVYWPEWDKLVGRLRHGWADWIGAGRGQIAMIPNTTFGINVVAEGIDWQPGDNVVIPGGEFPSNRYPWLHQRQEGVEVREVLMPTGPFDVDAFAEAIDDRTRAVSFSWVAYDHGTRAPIDHIARIAKKHGALVLLDGIQGLGVFPIDVEETPIDCLAADGHKWLLGPEGAGVMYLSHHALDVLRCRTVGWGSAQNSHNFSQPDFVMKEDASRYEGGSANLCGLMAFYASCQLFWRVTEKFGKEAIADRVLGLASRLADGLAKEGADLAFPYSGDSRAEPALQSGIVNFKVPGVEPAAFRDAARQAGCVVSCRGGGVRASIHAYNNDADIERLLAAVRNSRASA